MRSITRQNSPLLSISARRLQFHRQNSFPTTLIERSIRTILETVETSNVTQPANQHRFTGSSQANQHGEARPGAYHSYGRPVGLSIARPSLGSTRPSYAAPMQRPHRLGVADRMSSRTFNVWLIGMQQGDDNAAMRRSNSDDSIVLNASVRRASWGNQAAFHLNAVPPEMRPVVPTIGQEEESGFPDRAQEAAAARPKRWNAARIFGKPKLQITKKVLGGLKRTSLMK